MLEAGSNQSVSQQLLQQKWVGILSVVVQARFCCAGDPISNSSTFMVMYEFQEIEHLYSLWQLGIRWQILSNSFQALFQHETPNFCCVSQRETLIQYHGFYGIYGRCTQSFLGSVSASNPRFLLWKSMGISNLVSSAAQILRNREV